MKTTFFTRTAMLMLFAFSVHFASAATLHFILVWHPDPNIGATADARNLKIFARTVAEVSGLELNILDFQVNEEQRLNAAVSGLTAGSDDVIWFYYSGHGINSGNGWPGFKAGDPRTGTNYIETGVRETLLRKNARLNLITYDCCNYTSTVHPWADNSITNRNINTNYVTLFKRAKGTLMMSAASDALYAYGQREMGGFFTQTFMRAVGRCTETDPGQAWESVLQDTRSATNGMCRAASRTEQNPKWYGTIERQSAQQVQQQQHVIDAPEGYDLNTGRSIQDY